MAKNEKEKENVKVEAEAETKVEKEEFNFQDFLAKLELNKYLKSGFLATIQKAGKTPQTLSEAKKQLKKYLNNGGR